MIEQLNPELRAVRTIQAPQQVQFDHATQQYVVSQKAFRRGSDGTISVDLEEALAVDNLPLDHNFGGVARAVGMVAHKVGRFTTAGYEVSHVPLDTNPYHGEAAGNPDTKTRRELAETCEIIVQIDSVEAQRQKELEQKLAEQAAR